MAWCVPMTLGAYTRDADDAGFSLRRCVRSPGAIAGCPGQHNYWSVPNPKSKPNLQKIGSYGRFGPIQGSVFLEVDHFLGPGE